MSLFATPKQTSNALVEFRAGKMHLSGTTVIADTRKGKVKLIRSPDNFLHFQWLERPSGKMEDDLTIFPDECDFLPVPQCTTGRVFVLKFRQAKERRFYWMQEPNKEKDEEIKTKVNQLLNSTAPKTPKTPTKKPTKTQTTPRKQKQTKPVNKDAQDISNLLLNALKNVQFAPKKGRRVRDILSPNIVLEALENDQIREQLLEFLPESQRSLEDIQAFIHSSQYIQSLKRFEHAVESTSSNQMFGIPTSKKHGFEGLLDGLHQMSPKSSQDSENKDQKMDIEEDEKKEDEKKEDEKEDEKKDEEKKDEKQDDEKNQEKKDDKQDDEK